MSYMKPIYAGQMSYMTQKVFVYTVRNDIYFRERRNLTVVDQLDIPEHVKDLLRYHSIELPPVAERLERLIDRLEAGYLQ